MKSKLIGGLATSLFMFCMVGMANATLIDRGAGLIYDDVLNITWIQDANYAQTSGYDSDGRMNWNDAMAWAEQFEYGGYSDWRLPEVNPINDLTFNYTHANDGTTDSGTNISAPGTLYSGSVASENAFMYYNNLGNLSRYYADGTFGPPLNFDIKNSGPFINIQFTDYWSGTLFDSGRAFYLSFLDGEQFGTTTSDHINGSFAWAVRDGDSVAPVPEPTTMLLLGTGIVGLAGIRLRKRKK